MRKLAKKMSKITFSELCKLCKCSQEHGKHFFKNSWISVITLWHFTCHPLPSICDNMDELPCCNSPTWGGHIWVENQQPGSHQRKAAAHSTPHFQRIVLMWPGSCFPGKPTWKSVLCTWSDSKVTQRRKLLPQILFFWGCFSAAVTENCSTLWLSEVVDNNWSK